MAFWVVGGDSPREADALGTYIDGGKRRVSHGEDAEHPAFYDLSKRARLSDWGGNSGDTKWDAADKHQHVHHGHHHLQSRAGAPSEACIRVNNLAFLVIRERSPTPEPVTSAAAAPGLRRSPCAMERTQSGLSISSDTSRHSSQDDENDASLLGDLAAARLVRDHVAGYRRRYPDSQHERILKSLVSPRRGGAAGADFPLDNDALRSIFSAANELFFASRLRQRVGWDWSHPASAQYESHIVGTTALRRSARLGGYETLIVLSSPILRDTKYNRRLLISTFLHEMIHSFLFVTCGLKARREGGHTEGFRLIAGVIDGWVGGESLRLSDMEADLERFRDNDDGGAASLPPHVMARPPSPFDARSGDARTHSPIQGRPAAWCPGERTEYLEPRARRHHDHDYDKWEWCEREGFQARGMHGAGSSYVY